MFVVLFAIEWCLVADLCFGGWSSAVSYFLHFSWCFCSFKSTACILQGPGPGTDPLLFLPLARLQLSVASADLGLLPAERVAVAEWEDPQPLKNMGLRWLFYGFYHGFIDYGFYHGSTIVYSHIEQFSKADVELLDALWWKLLNKRVVHHFLVLWVFVLRFRRSLETCLQEEWKHIRTFLTEIDMKIHEHTHHSNHSNNFMPSRSF